MTLLILLLTIIALLIVYCISWFLTMKANGKCPLCILKQYVFPNKITIDVENEPSYNTVTVSTPPMGWSSWNTFRNEINEDLIYETAVAMKKSGLQDAGYQYINIDDCWQSSMRDDLGRLQGDFVTFPNGMENLIQKINDLDLKVGLYSSNGTLTCEDLPASLGNESIDAKTLASWGCEFFKYDYCHHKIIPGDAPLIEGISISKSGEKIIKELKVTDADFMGMAKIVEGKDNDKYIGFLSYGSGKALFNFEMEENDEYILTFIIHKMRAKKGMYLQALVNDELHEIIFEEQNAYSKTSHCQIKVNLKTGKNTILLQNPVNSKADSAYIQYLRMGNELKKATKEWAQLTQQPEKPIVFSICEWGSNKPWLWGSKSGNLWRTTPDICAKWVSILGIYEFNIRLWKHSSFGAWNDPDMLEVGNGKLTEDENKAHFSLWCMMASPLILGNDIRKFIDNNGEAISENRTLQIVTNKSLINIDQDALGLSAKRIKFSSIIDILARPLANGDIALCLFNKGSKKHSTTFDIDTLVKDNYFNWRTVADNYEIHDLWSDERFEGKKISTFIPKHGVSIYRIKRL